MDQKSYIVPLLAEDEKKTDWNDSVVLGVDVAQLEDGRPIRFQAWAESGYTFVTYVVSIIDLEDFAKEELIKYLIRQGNAGASRLWLGSPMTS